MFLINLLLFLVACFFLVLSSNWIIRLIKRIAEHLRLNEFTVAFVIMAFSTSIPELAVGINAGLTGVPLLSLGNVIGSNIADLTLVIGIAAILGKGIKIRSKHIRKDSKFMALILLAPLILMVPDKNLSRIDGLILILIFLTYMIYLIKRKASSKTVFVSKSNPIVNFIFFGIAIAMLFTSAHFVVEYAVKLAIELLVPAILIGLFLVAIGTSLPELVFESQAAIKKKGDLVAGDAMGSVVCNSTFVIGITAVLSPIQDGSMVFLTSIFFMLLSALIFVILLRKNKGITLFSSVILILIYLSYAIFGFFIR